MKMKQMIVAAVAGAVCCASALDLNGTWEFRFDEGRPITAVAGPAFEPTGRMVVPGCFDAMPDTFMKRGTAMYRRTFTLEKGVAQAWLVIDGMGLYGKFWVDGREIGIDDLPYSRVELATGPLAAGAHTLVAAVDNRFDWSYQKLAQSFYDFHFWGGFYHGVSLVFDNRKLFVRTRDYRMGTVEIEAVNFKERDFDATLVFDDKNEVKAAFKNGRTTVKVPAFKLWSPDAPNLHTVSLGGSRSRATSADAQERVPPVVARFGIRTIEARNGGFYLNGKRIFLKGANRHDQQMQLGASTPEGFMLTDIQNLKKMGGNFFRGAHYPQAQRFLDLCDEMGVLVWEESLGWGNGQHYTQKGRQDDLTDPGFIAKQLEQTKLMVRNSFNHPSVIIFAFLNECDSTKPTCKNLVDQLITTIREEDSGRLITFACNRTRGDLCHANTDIVAFNTYPGTINGYPGVHDEFKEKIHNLEGYGVDWLAKYLGERYPGKTLLVSEMGAAGQYGCHDPSCPADSEDFEAEHNALGAEAVWSNPAIAGISFWQFFDTRTCGRECLHNGKKHQAKSWAGQFSSDRKPKLAVGVLTDWFTNHIPANMGK
ncbi:MAG: hypothetical protein J6V72_01825 [Kiritimatiellae bacterium]|nr:hypothetical protein [Kiritimatiellia bacterium]